MTFTVQIYDGDSEAPMDGKYKIRPGREVNFLVLQGNGDTDAGTSSYITS